MNDQDQHVLDSGMGDFYDSAPALASGGPVDSIVFGPTFMAQIQTEDACCGEGIIPGEDIRADGQGGWIHAADECQQLSLGSGPELLDRVLAAQVCTTCFLVHKGDCW